MEVAAGFPAEVFILCALDNTPEGLRGAVGAFCRQAAVFHQAAFRPQACAFQGLLLIAAGVEERRQLVEGEDDVCAQVVLDLHGHFGGEAVQGAVEVGAEGDAVVVHIGHAFFAFADFTVAVGAGKFGGQHFFEAGAEGKNLEAAGVGVGGAVPVHEGSDAAGLVHNVGAGLEVEVVGVAEDGLCAGGADLLGGEGFDGGAGADGDEGGGVNVPVGGVDGAGAAEWFPCAAAGDGFTAGGFAEVGAQGEGGTRLLVDCHANIVYKRHHRPGFVALRDKHSWLPQSVSTVC